MRLSTAIFPCSNTTARKSTTLEAGLLDNHHQVHLTSIHAIKQDLLQLRRAFWPMRDMLYSLLRDKQELIHESTRVYFRDVYDHTVQLVDLLGNLPRVGFGLARPVLVEHEQPDERDHESADDHQHTLYPADIHRRVYGMNFDTSKPWNMPELLLALRLRHHARRDGCDRGGDAGLLCPQGLDRQQLVEVVACNRPFSGESKGSVSG